MLPQCAIHDSPNIQAMLLLAYTPTAHLYQAIYIYSQLFQSKAQHKRQEMKEQKGKDWLVTRGQALHMGSNESPTLALIHPNRSSEEGGDG